MAFADIVFYAFAALMIVSSIGVIMTRNPVHAVLLLIFTFFNAAGIFVLMGAEFIAMLLVIVYVGAVAVLFLFVVMMLNINFAKLKEGFLSYLPLGLIMAGVLFMEIYAVLKLSTQSLVLKPDTLYGHSTNTHALGSVLYTDYIIAFQTAGLILLVAMIGAIALTLRKRDGVKRQNMIRQFDRDPKEAIVMTNPESGKGIE